MNNLYRNLRLARPLKSKLISHTQRLIHHSHHPKVILGDLPALFNLVASVRLSGKTPLAPMTLYRQTHFSETTHASWLDQCLPYSPYTLPPALRALMLEKNPDIDQDSLLPMHTMKEAIESAEQTLSQYPFITLRDREQLHAITQAPNGYTLHHTDGKTITLPADTHFYQEDYQPSSDHGLSHLPPLKAYTTLYHQPKESMPSKLMLWGHLASIQRFAHMHPKQHIFGILSCEDYETWHIRKHIPTLCPFPTNVTPLSISHIDPNHVDYRYKLEKNTKDKTLSLYDLKNKSMCVEGRGYSALSAQPDTTLLKDVPSHAQHIVRQDALKKTWYSVSRQAWDDLLCASTQWNDMRDPDQRLLILSGLHKSTADTVIDRLSRHLKDCGFILPYSRKFFDKMNAMGHSFELSEWTRSLDDRFRTDLTIALSCLVKQQSVNTLDKTQHGMNSKPSDDPKAPPVFPQTKDMVKAQYLWAITQSFQIKYNKPLDEKRQEKFNEAYDRLEKEAMQQIPPCPSTY